MFRVVLTGGMGCGKSIVAGCFAELGVPVIEADQVNRELLETDPIVFEEIVSRFGKTILDGKGLIDRKKLRSFLTKSHSDKVWLEALLHPLIFEAMDNQLKNKDFCYGLLVIPLWFENRSMINSDRVLVVDSFYLLRIFRLILNRQESLKEITAVIKLQTKQKILIEKADEVIYNNSSLKTLKKMVESVHHNYLNLVIKGKLTN
jgi:dephospho-CoA kinase